MHRVNYWYFMDGSLTIRRITRLYMRAHIVNMIWQSENTDPHIHTQKKPPNIKKLLIIIEKFKPFYLSPFIYQFDMSFTLTRRNKVSMCCRCMKILQDIVYSSRTTGPNTRLVWKHCSMNLPFRYWMSKLYIRNTGPNIGMFVLMIYYANSKYAAILKYWTKHRHVCTYSDAFSIYACSKYGNNM